MALGTLRRPGKGDLALAQRLLDIGAERTDLLGWRLWGDNRRDGALPRSQVGTLHAQEPGASRRHRAINAREP